MVANDVRDLMGQARALPFGALRRGLLDRALSLTRESGNEDLEYEVRERLTTCAEFTGDTDTELTSFAWRLGKFDSDPIRFPERTDGERGVLSEFAWVIGLLDSSPIFSLKQCEALLDDMEARYRCANRAMSPVVTSRFVHAWNTGDLDRARALRTQVLIAPRDPTTDCQVCELSVLTRFAAETGEDELAVSLLSELTDQPVTCPEEPELALAATLLAQLRVGRLREARYAYLWSYLMARHNTRLIGAVAEHLQFCAITGNETQGLTLVERHLPWLVRDPVNQDGCLRLVSSVALALDAASRVGLAGQVVRSANTTALRPFFGSHAGAWTVAELAPVAWAAADRIAAAFDERNGNSYRSDQVAAKRALLGTRYDVNLAVDSPVPRRR